jgi:hypothetical protein
MRHVVNERKFPKEELKAACSYALRHIFESFEALETLRKESGRNGHGEPLLRNKRGKEKVRPGRWSVVFVRVCCFWCAAPVEKDTQKSFFCFSIPTLSKRFLPPWRKTRSMLRLSVAYSGKKRTERA